MELLMGRFIELDIAACLQVVMLGAVGGVLSGFVGSGGAFFMTPGMMNLGVPGVVAVASNITHKFGKAMMGSRKHGEYGNVDKRLALFMVVTSFIGIRVAVMINSALFGNADSHGTGATAASNLYISMIFILILFFVAVSMLRDAMKSSKEGGGPSMKISSFISRLYLPPYVYFKVSNVKVSLWVIMVCGLATGYLAGTIGVGGFIGVPAMIYIFGVPTAVAAGSELYLAMFMGAWGALSYAFEGFVDIRLAMLLYLGSLVGVYVGAYGVKVVNEVMIRMVTGLIILLCVLSRAVAVPMYLRQMGIIDTNPAWDPYFNGISKGILFFAGISGVSIILYNVIKAYRQRRRIRSTLIEPGKVTKAASVTS